MKTYDMTSADLLNELFAGCTVVSVREVTAQDNWWFEFVIKGSRGTTWVRLNYSEWGMVGVPNDTKIKSSARQF